MGVLRLEQTYRLMDLARRGLLFPQSRPHQRAGLLAGGNQEVYPWQAPFLRMNILVSAGMECACTHSCVGFVLIKCGF